MRNSVKKAVLVGATVLVVGGTGAGVAAAQTTTPAPTPPAAASGHQKHPGAHGEVVRHGKKGDRTVDYQRGRVTAVTPTTLTVTSKDGFVGTYALTPTTKVTRDKQASPASAIAVGDHVGVVATKTPTGLEATHVRDRGPAKTPAAPKAPASTAPTPTG